MAVYSLFIPQLLVSCIIIEDRITQLKVTRAFFLLFSIRYILDVVLNVTLTQRTIEEMEEIFAVQSVIRDGLKSRDSFLEFLRKEIPRLRLLKRAGIVNGSIYSLWFPLCAFWDFMMTTCIYWIPLFWSVWMSVNVYTLAKKLNIWTRAHISEEMENKPRAESRMLNLTALEGKSEDSTKDLFKTSVDVHVDLNDVSETI
mmetsp:Transcript_17548/g.22353  ORF Transcript_17548/g.22353 Transcript_17548/m.22353 type:complete len:200 (-) Transcript_17548:1153-1752(-)